MKNWFLYGFVLILVCSSCASKKAKHTDHPGPIYTTPTQANSLMDAVEMAKLENKSVFLNVGASWCLPCKIMAKEVLSLIEVQDFIHNNYIYYYCDAEKGSGPNISELYQISSVPTLIILDQKGAEVRRNQGALGRSELFKFLKVNK